MPRGIYDRSKTKRRYRKHAAPTATAADTSKGRNTDGTTFHNGSLERKMSPEFKTFAKQVLSVAELLGITQNRALDLVIDHRHKPTPQ